MILDKYISFKNKVIISIICAGLWIYFRTSNCYDMIPRKHILPVIFVMIWAYLNYYEPLFLPIGLFILIIYSYFNTLYFILKDHDSIISRETKKTNKTTS
jgi:hypothetical protein